MATPSQVLHSADLSLPLFIRGKVRDTYKLDSRLLIIATDRISAFDVILPCGISDKGLVLNQLSAFWFEKTTHLMANHLVETVDDRRALDRYLSPSDRFFYPAYLVGRSMVVKKVERVPIECVVRGYLSGSAWEEYRQSATVSGSPLPKGLLESQELPQPLFTPTTKAEIGHDQPLTMDGVKNLVGESLAEELKEKSLAIYAYAREYARERGIIIADTKMEFGLDNGQLILIDELLTPDSSRFWDAKQYEVGQSQPSYDKQPVRDWLAQSGWNQQPPAPMLPLKVIEATARRYREAYERLTERKLK
ncbi:MAG TPA: phosphoribosylaminoimidazolesuccinocarboxamide synthase [Dehalococcoidales bacterium]|jgi:phosphoribosylaminoimidazole-succinocarboxamide synthase|nr:phosphoribosylaminoimidazolesuccinocarboxamide synthase [Dehalococcoidales bacterium]MDP7109700.1 phosphoribosylaminoimidazolesuccinocarboxamide synthase [Dehalococcoidales bacterium]MDP7409872.1 phosphoribosylaminoimidazolesuccinocarboxamide synthase [Dehalococcoidales bacterium]HJM36646.1 phosphoribosylaminoimidazolesuccinocarboxamide synthase [Dehalococcoidales bacterium]